MNQMKGSEQSRRTGNIFDDPVSASSPKVRRFFDKKKSLKSVNPVISLKKPSLPPDPEYV
jgi:hypothetical protein